MPNKSFEVNVKPEILVWARESIGFSEQEVAKRLKDSVEMLKKLETGGKKPTLSQLEKFASLYKRPLAAFLLPELPEEPPLPQDFRTLPSPKKKPLYPKTFFSVRRARRLQYSEIELLKTLGETVKSFSLKSSLSENPEMLAVRVKQELVGDDLAPSMWPSSDVAFEKWKNILEQNGVLVFQISIPLKQKEVRGFSLVEGELPAIIVRSSDETNAKIFTLFHELAHILLRVGGICDMIDMPQTKDIEKFCNHFAGAFLVPKDELLGHLAIGRSTEKQEWTDKQLKTMANHFKVSKEVILRRLLFYGLTTQAYYSRKHEEWKKEFENRKIFSKKGKDTIKICVRERGKKYVSLVFQAYSQDKITYLDVADYLDVKLDQIQKVQEAV